jgi:hypothetical protein
MVVRSDEFLSSPSESGNDVGFCKFPIVAAFLTALCAPAFTATTLKLMVRDTGFEPANASFTALPARGANGVSLPFIARRVTK